MIRLGSVVNSGVRITQTFGNRPDYYRQWGFNGHEGLDLAANAGTIITAATKGTVTFAGSKGDNYGNHVIIWDSDQNVKTLYAHLDKVTVKKDARVFEGDQIGTMGKTGNSTGVHLHFGVMRTQSGKSDPLNPFSATIQTDAPLNPNNGYKGWENPQDDSLFDWPYSYGLGDAFIPEELGGPSPDGTTTTTTTKNSFDSIFAQYYPGWGRTEAEADFNKTYGGDLNKLKIARGLADEGKKKTVKSRPAALKKIYQLNPQFDQMSLKEIAGGGILTGRVDVLANFLGIQENERLRGGQELSLSGFPTDYYPDSSEWLDFLRLTAKGKIGKAGDYYIKPEYAGLSLRDIAGKGVAVGRTDVLATFLGISENMKIPGDQGFGTQAFPNSYIPNSSEWEGFNRIFTTTRPAPREEDSGTDAPAGDDDETGTPIIREPSIRVTSTPDRAKFYIDGLYFSDLTPSNKGYPVVAGVHEVRVEKTGYQTWTDQVEVGEGEQVVVNAQLQAGSGATPTPTQPTYTPNPIAIEAIIARIDQIERILTEMGRL